MTQRNVREERRWAGYDDECGAYNVLPKGLTRKEASQWINWWERLVRVTILVPKGKK